MLRLRDILYNQSERYRRLSAPIRLKEGGDDRSAQQERDHRQLMEAALARDAELVGKVMAEHLNRTAHLVRVFTDDAEASTASRRRRGGRRSEALAGGRRRVIPIRDGTD